jgi:glycosyltransferase involved in cell wall biosynthesis
LFDRYLIIRKIKKYIKSKQIDHLLFMDFDQYQLPFYFNKFNLHVSGILFRPHHRIESTNRTFSSLISTSLRRFKKKTAEKLIVGKSEIKNIFVLNDFEGVNALNKIHNSSVFKYLPDPVFSYMHLKSSDELPEKEPDTYRFLIFGSITVRKNFSNIIKAYDRASFTRKTELLLVGPCSDVYWQKLNILISQLISVDGINKKIFIKKSFVSNSDMDYYFSICDVCLLIYKEFFGSSGLLGRAALHKMKVIGSNTGLLNELINTYKMGMTVDPSDINLIAQTLKDIINYHVNTSDLEDYYKNHMPERFLSVLAESVTL